MLKYEKAVHEYIKYIYKMRNKNFNKNIDIIWIMYEYKQVWLEKL